MKTIINVLIVQPNVLHVTDLKIITALHVQLVKLFIMEHVYQNVLNLLIKIKEVVNVKYVVLHVLHVMNIINAFHVKVVNI